MSQENIDNPQMNDVMKPGPDGMGTYKETTKYNVVSMRISDKEKQALDELTRYSKKSKSRLLREAFMMYCPMPKT